MEVRDPLTKEKAMTPIIIIIEQNILSCMLFPTISPYPTVVIVVQVQYRLVAYNSSPDKFSVFP